MSTESEQCVYDMNDDDEQQLIEEGRYGIFHVKTGWLQKKNMMKELMSKFQRKYLVAVATTAPAIKFAWACIMLAYFIEQDAMGIEVMHPVKNGGLRKDDIIFLYTIMTIPLSAITLFLGTMIFSDYPRVTITAVNGYLTYRGAVVLVELAGWIFCATQYSLTVREHITTQLVAITEVYSIILLKLCSKHPPNLDPVEGPSTMEMATINTNLTRDFRPISRFQTCSW